jgi:hypothetical protein
LVYNSVSLAFSDGLKARLIKIKIMSSVYQINKGINKPLEFKGLRAQYIAYLAVGLVLLLIGFAVLYICGLSLFIILPVILGLGAGLFFTVFRLSHKYGEHGLMKYLAKRSLPRYLKFNSRKVFTSLKVKS